MIIINQILRDIQERQTSILPLISTTRFLLFSLILFFIATLPSLHPLSAVAGWYNEKRLAQIFILIALAGVLISSSHFQNYVLSILIDLSDIKKLLLALFFVFGVVSSSKSILPIWAFLELGNYFLLGLLALFITYSIQCNSNAEKVIVIAFCSAVALYLIAFLASLLAGLTNDVIDYHYLLSGFINRRFLNQFQSISFPILLMAPFFLNAGKKVYFILSALAAFWFMLMLVSDGRGVVLASLTGTLLSCVLIPYARVKWLLHIILVVALGTLLFLGFDHLLSSNEVINGDLLRDTSGGRLTIWLTVLETIKENPALGIGPMHYAILPNPFQLAHPHNITLQLIVEYGIPATFSIIIFFLISFTLWVRRQQKSVKRNPSLIPTALTASFIAAVIHGHLSGVFVMPLSQLSFVVICGWMISISRKNTGIAIHELKSFSYPSRALLILATIISLSTMLAGSYPNTKSLIMGGGLKTTNLNIDSPAATAPRYWSGGYR